MAERKMIVVALEPLQPSDGVSPETLVMRLEVSLRPIPGMNVFQPFVCPSLPQWSIPGAVELYGDTLRTKLLAHQAIDQAFQAALGEPANDLPSLYFSIGTAQAEPFYWETLSSQGKFWALDPGLPVGRMVFSGSSTTGIRPFAPPLRLMAVLSALGLPAREQWEGLARAVGAARQQGLAIDLRVLVSELPLHQELEALGPSVVTSSLLGSDPLQLKHAIDDFQPSILHFFCHGTAGQGTPRLQLATPADWETQGLTNATAGSLPFAFSQLEHLLAVKDLWLVTLNCCEGGKATGDVHSLAYSLVASSGVPAAIGMMEPVAAADAHAFCAGLYGSLLRYLRLSLTAGGPVVIDWAKAMYDPRYALSQKQGRPPADNRQWALPVLYVVRDAFQVQPSELRDEAQLARFASSAAVLGGLLNVLPPDSTPPEVRQDLLALHQQSQLAWQPTAAPAVAEAAVVAEAPPASHASSKAP